MNRLSPIHGKHILPFAPPVQHGLAWQLIQPAPALREDSVEIRAARNIGAQRVEHTNWNCTYYSYIYTVYIYISISRTVGGSAKTKPNKDRPFFSFFLVAVGKSKARTQPRATSSHLGS